MGGESHGILKCERINWRQCKVISGSPDPAKVSVAHILNAQGGIDCGDASAVNLCVSVASAPNPVLTAVPGRILFFVCRNQIRDNNHTWYVHAAGVINT